MNPALGIIERQVKANIDNFINSMELLEKLYGETNDPEVLKCLNRLAAYSCQHSYSGAPASENNAAEVAVLHGAPASENNLQPRVEPELNYFGPKNSLSIMLCKEWFDEVSANKRKYTREWREKLMEALLDSEYKDEIAIRWEDNKKQIQMRCEIVGTLIDAKVIKGSYRMVAALLPIKDVKPDSMARYMSNAVNQSYYEWLPAFAQQ